MVPPDPLDAARMCENRNGRHAAPDIYNPQPAGKHRRCVAFRV